MPRKLENLFLGLALSTNLCAADLMAQDSLVADVSAQMGEALRDAAEPEPDFWRFVEQSGYEIYFPDSYAALLQFFRLEGGEIPYRSDFDQFYRGLSAGGGSISYARKYGDFVLYDGLRREVVVGPLLEEKLRIAFFWKILVADKLAPLMAREADVFGMDGGDFYDFSIDEVALALSNDGFNARAVVRRLIDGRGVDDKLLKMFFEELAAMRRNEEADKFVFVGEDETQDVEDPEEKKKLTHEEIINKVIYSPPAIFRKEYHPFLKEIGCDEGITMADPSEEQLSATLSFLRKFRSEHIELNMGGGRLFMLLAEIEVVEVVDEDARIRLYKGINDYYRSSLDVLFKPEFKDWPEEARIQMMNEVFNAHLLKQVVRRELFVLQRLGEL